MKPSPSLRELEQDDNLEHMYDPEQDCMEDGCDSDWRTGKVVPRFRDTKRKRNATKTKAKRKAAKNARKR